MDSAHDQLSCMRLDGTLAHVVEVGRTEVARHDHHGVGERDRAPAAVGETPGVEDPERQDLAKGVEGPHRYLRLPTAVLSKMPFRIEDIALHVTYDFGGAQFYIGCAQVTVTGGGTGTPGPLVAFPGAYTVSALLRIARRLITNDVLGKCRS